MTGAGASVRCWQHINWNEQPVTQSEGYVAPTGRGHGGLYSLSVNTDFGSKTRPGCADPEKTRWMKTETNCAMLEKKGNISKCTIIFLYPATHCGTFYAGSRGTMRVVENETVKCRSCRTWIAQQFPFHSFFLALSVTLSGPILATCTKIVFVSWSKSVSGAICLKHKCAFPLICCQRRIQAASDEHVTSSYKTVLFIRRCSRFVCQFHFTDFVELRFRYLLFSHGNCTVWTPVFLSRDLMTDYQFDGNKVRKISLIANSCFEWTRG